jgi:predicted nuclease with TOPRIM domain
MNAEQAEMLEGIKEKIQSIKIRLKEHQGRNRELEERNEELQQMVQQKQSQISELEEKNQKLSLMKGLIADSDDARDAKVRINRIVREIDKCIALLNRT